jgi:hypothetical protein
MMANQPFAAPSMTLGTDESGVCPREVMAGGLAPYLWILAQKRAHNSRI